MPKSDLKILEAAIKLEEDGRAFYLKASKEAKNLPAKRLLSSLADEELKHIERISEIHEGLKGERNWSDFRKPISKLTKASMKLIFKPLSKSERKHLKADPSNLEAIKLAMKKEKSSYDFYNEQAKATNVAIAKIFYNRLKAEEELHYDLLEEAYSFLSDTAGWFVKEEGRVMEGG
ncbi:MAG: ferritin family protein [Candidatus Omnitrophota bacterium]